MATKPRIQLKSWIASWVEQGWLCMVRDISGLLLLFAMSVLLVMLLAGDHFKDSLTYLGLYNSEGGVYAHCSDPRNRNNRFCKRPNSRDELRRQTSGIPFSLSGP